MTTVIEIAMAQLGLEWQTLVYICVGTLLYLLLILVFLFIGIRALTSTSSNFNSMINSLLPVLAGGGLFKFKQVNVKLDSLDDIVQQGLAGLRDFAH